MFGYTSPKKYANSERPELRMKIVSDDEEVEKVDELLKKRLDHGYPVPFLLLKHENRSVFEDYIWHWFMIIGYENEGKELLVQTATYGEKKMFSFQELWNTGNDEKGGMVLYELKMVS